MTFERIAQLEREREAFAVATVVVRRSPVSSHLGDRAIVLSDGRMEGFVGGSCSRDIVRRQALDAMHSGSPRLLRIRPGLPDEPNADPDTFIVPMGCASEGAVDIYIEPHLPARMLIVAGYTPVAHALRAFGAATASFRVVAVVAGDELRDVTGAIPLSELPSFLEAVPPGELQRSAAIVASQGHYDEAALSVLLRGNMPAFVGLVASRKRAASVFGILAQEGVPRERIELVRNPAGFDIGAHTPDGVAISILAEIIATGTSAAALVKTETAIDPVCGMEVEVVEGSQRFEHAGVAYVFCCAHCCAAFAAEPNAYAVTPTS